MPSIFQKIDRIKLTYDMTYQAVMFLCKALLVMDILITGVTAVGRYIPFISDPTWSEEVALTCMFCMAALSTVPAIRRKAHICATAFDQYLPEKIVKSLDIIASLAMLALAFITITVGQKYVTGIGSEGAYVSMSKLSRFWMYFPVSLAGVAMLVSEVEVLYSHVRGFFVREGME